MGRNPASDSQYEPGDFETPEDGLVWSQESADPKDIRTK